MLDIGFIRENADLIKAGAVKKHLKVDLDRLLVVDDERKRLRQELDEKRAEQNRASHNIVRMEAAEKAKVLESMRHLKEGMAEVEESYKKAMEEWQTLMLSVPNIPDISVPEGTADTDNQEIRVWGEKPEFSFAPKSHIELMTRLDMADFERGAKVAGFRGYFLKNDGALLSYALWHFLSDHFVRKGGFVPMITPSLVKREAFLGTGYLPQGEEDLYKTQDGDYFTGTAEVGTMAYHMDEVIEKKDLPLRFFSFSPGFRREAGAHGKDTKGLVRVHEIYKFEQVVLGEASHEESVRLHEELTANAEEVVQALGIPYHVVANCGGDLGLGQVKKYDIECWMPSEGTYRETHSSSYFHDFQARRLNIRYRDTDLPDGKAGGTLKFVHSLNNTALATPRILAVIVENFQQEDGTIRVPEALVPYVGKTVIGKSG